MCVGGAIFVSDTSPEPVMCGPTDGIQDLGPSGHQLSQGGAAHSGGRSSAQSKSMANGIYQHAAQMREPWLCLSGLQDWLTPSRITLRGSIRTTQAPRQVFEQLLQESSGGLPAAVRARCGYWGCSVDPFIQSQSGGMATPQRPSCCTACALRGQCVGTACILRTQRPGYSPKNTCHLTGCTAKQQSPHENDETAFNLVLHCPYEQTTQPCKVCLLRVFWCPWLRSWRRR